MMNEDFLHFLWKKQLLGTDLLLGTQKEKIRILDPGEMNNDAGPDFFNAQIKIGEQLWAGNVEIHIKSSDWFLHNHEQDKAYDNVILHVVWEHDTDVYRKDNTTIATLVLKDLVNKEVLNNYEKLFLIPIAIGTNKWINCEHDFKEVDNFILNNWLERLYIERLERKAKAIEVLLKESKNDWEAVLFKMLAKNFGLKVNGESFFSLAQSIDFSIIRKTQSKQHVLEALLFGQAGLLEFDIEDGYYLSLVNEYKFLTQKFNLKNTQVLPIQFFRLRPANFPTIRLSQLASLYNVKQNLFSKIIKTEDLNEFYDLFEVATPEFWNTHYTFQKESKASKKRVTKSFVDLLLINTILPIKFCYAKHQGVEVDISILKIANAMTSERNSIIDAFNNLKTVSKSSLDSQALIQLKTEYCDKNKCLQCAIGYSLLNK